MKEFVILLWLDNVSIKLKNIRYYVLDIGIGLKIGSMRRGPQQKMRLIDYAMRSGAPMEVIENLQEMEDEGEIYESIEDIWPDYPSKEDFFFNEDEY